MKTVRPLAVAALLIPLTLPALPSHAQTGANPSPALPGTAGAPAADRARIQALLKLGQVKEALPLAEAAARATPNDAATLLLYGRILAANGQPKEAIAALTTATTLDSKNADAFLALGDAQFLRYASDLRAWLKSHSSDLLGQVHGMIPTVTAGPPAGPNSILTEDVLINDRSAAQMNGKEWDKFCGVAKEALAAYRSALALTPGDRKATRSEGLAHLVLGDWKDAADDFDKAGVPAFDSFYYELARNVYDAHLMGDPAMRIWAKAEEADPSNAWAYWYQRDLYDEFHHSDWRYGYFDAMCKLYSGRIQNQSDAKKYTPKDALKELQGLTESHADFAPGWRGLGMAALVTKDQKQARAAFEKAISLNPNDWYSHLQLGVLQLNAKEAAAQKTLGQAAKNNPDSALAWHALGAAAEHNKDLDSAVSYYERAADLAPLWPEAHYSLGALLLDRREGAEALPHLQRYLDLQPNGDNAREVRSAVEQLKKILAAQG